MQHYSKFGKHSKENAHNMTKQMESLKKIIDKMSIEEILNYLDDNLMPIELKMKMFERMEYMIIDRNVAKVVKKYFASKSDLNEEYLTKPYWPLMVKRQVAETIYGNEVNKIVKDCNASFDVKKTIIKYCFHEYELLNIMSDDLEPRVLDYIINSRFTFSSELVLLLSNNRISNRIKEKVITEKLNLENIFDILQSNSISKAMQQKIYDSKKNMIDDYVTGVKDKDLLETINSLHVPKEIRQKIIELREKEIILMAKKTNINQFYVLLSFSHDEKFSKLLIDNCPIKAKMCIFFMMQTDVLRFLSNKAIPEDFKENIMLKKKRLINKAIDDLDFSQIRRYYLTNDCNYLSEIQKLIVDKKLKVIEKGIDDIDNSDVLRKIFYTDYAQILKEILITRRIDENNIFEAFDSYNYHKDDVELILTLKKEVILKYLQGLNLTELLELKKIKNYELKKKIIDNFSDVFFDKMKDVDDETLYLYFNNPNISFASRTIILRKFNFDDDDIYNCLELLRHNDTKSILSNYDKVKSFFNKLDIDFDSFIQYGCGTSTYSSWLNELIELLNCGNEDRLIAAYMYLNNNFYKEDNRTNTVITNISNFLKTLNNYTNNSKLLDSLVSNNVSLTNKDKANLEFLFNYSNNKTDILSLDQIDDFRKNVYQKYVELLNDVDLNIATLKTAFKEFVFCGADLALKDIGGTTGLKILKRRNTTFPSVCNKIDDLLSYSELVERVNYAKDINALKKLMKEIIIDDPEKLKEIQSYSYHIDQKILDLFEHEFRINLTPISIAREKGSAINETLSLKYGGEVFDFFDKNYVLYAHVLREDVNINDMLNGNASSDSNFISVSPISYLGQSYYWDKRDLILAYDSVPKGNYICSSIYNMGSNRVINSNSYEVKNINHVQRGILETSAAIDENPETLLYRAGLRPCGLILINGKIPTDLEMEYHVKYNLPFIITQDVNTAIEKPKIIFNNKEKENTEQVISNLSTHFINLKNKIVFNKETPIYTGREIAIITDPHSMYEPTIAVLESIKQRDVDEIYSLGDNVALGANPDEVFDMLEYYGVKSVAGNAEYCNTLGVSPFTYLDEKRKENQLWTSEKLGKNRIAKMKLFPPSLDLIVGNKKIALCHFSNDVRWDYEKNSTWSYQSNFKKGISGLQFLYTNSDEAIKDIKKGIQKSWNQEMANGYLSALDHPIFNGKKINCYDAIFQGHVHFHMVDQINNTDIYTLRATGIGGDKDEKSLACYYILKERKNGGFDVEKVLIEFNKNSLISNTQSSGIPHKEKVLNFLKN